MLGLHALQLYGDLLAGNDVGAYLTYQHTVNAHVFPSLTKVDVTKAATANLSADTVFVAYTEILYKGHESARILTEIPDNYGRDGEVKKYVL